MPKKKSNAGRPSKMTDDTLLKLEAAFSIGATDEEACAHASVGTSAFYNYTKKHPEYVEKITGLKEKLPLKAKSEMAKLINEGDKQTVLWYLERKKRTEFSLRQEVDFKGEVKIPSNVADLKEACKEVYGELLGQIGGEYQKKKTTAKKK